MIFKIIGGKAVRYDSGGIDKIDDSTVDFSQAETRENIAPTDTMKTILGKTMKWFSDLSAGAASSLLGQNLTAGKVLVSDDGGKVAASVVDASKVGFLSGVTGDLQEQINSLNSAMESVNRVQTALTMSPAYLNTVDLINNYHNSYSNNLPDNTWYRYMANQRAAGGMLGGGYWCIEGVKSTKDWEWQMARSYLVLANGGLRYRTKQAGVWQPWEMVQ